MKRLGLLSVGLLLAACSKSEPPPEPVRPVLSIKVEALSEETLGRFAGSIQARYESNTGFRVGGRIASRNVDVGAEVEKGTLLATLDPSDQQNQLRSAQGDLAKIEAQLINAQANARRQQALFDRGVGAQAQLDIANTDLKTTQASLDQARAAVNQSKDQLGYTELRSDHKAVVTAWNAEAGQVVTAGQQVVTLAQPDIKEAVIDLPDTLVDQIPEGFNLSDWALSHRSLVWYFMLVSSSPASSPYLNLGREEDPAFTIKTMLIQANWPGASVNETVRQVTDRIEKKLEELDSLDYTKSVTTPARPSSSST
jgi:RND family efflux transporter MFP subunit